MPPLVPHRDKPKTPASLLRRVASLSFDLRGEGRLLLRLLAYTGPYRGRLLLAWLSTAGFAVAGAGLAYSVKPIFDEVLIRGINTAQVGVTILALYLVDLRKPDQ